MEDKVISTQRGPKSPYDAYMLFQSRDYSVPNKIGILKQLTDKDPLFAHEAAAWARKNPQFHGEGKFLRVLDEILTGLPVGEKRFTTSEQFRAFLRLCPLGSKLRITFSQNRIAEIRNLLPLQGSYLSFNSEELILLVSCVLESGRWEGITRTYGISLLSISPARLEVLAEELAKCVESVELVYTLEQFANALTGSKVKVISDLENVLRDNPEIDYDPDLFTQTVNELGYPQAVYWTGSFSGNSPLKVILDRFESDYARRSFLRIYVHKYRTLLGLPA